MVKIIFHTEQIDVRGTCNAIYYYAHYNETLLNNESAILSKSNNRNTDSIALEKFENRFRIIYYNTKDEIPGLIKDFDIIYNIKYGHSDGFIFENIKNCVHAVFDMTQPHGDVFAGVSETLAKKFGKTLYVPHMIGLESSMTKENFRESFGIPANAIVFGRHGGQDTFNLDFAKNAISRIVRDKPDTYFVFVNTPAFDTHKNIFYLGKIITDEDKNKFINTCDAGLECGTLGHTFGLAIGEFSVNNKPNICYNGNIWNRCHIDILGNKGIYFQTEDELYNIFANFNKNSNIDYNCYTDYSPEKIMKQFEEVFIL